MSQRECPALNWPPAGTILIPAVDEVSTIPKACQPFSWAIFIPYATSGSEDQPLARNSAVSASERLGVVHAHSSTVLRLLSVFPASL